MQQSRDIIWDDSGALPDVLQYNAQLTKHIPKAELNSHMQNIYPHGISAFVVRCFDTVTGGASFGIVYVRDETPLYKTTIINKTKITTLFKL